DRVRRSERASNLEGIPVVLLGAHEISGQPRDLAERVQAIAHAFSRSAALEVLACRFDVRRCIFEASGFAGELPEAEVAARGSDRVLDREVVVAGELEVIGVEVEPTSAEV